MRKVQWMLLFGVGLFVSLTLLAGHFWRGETMTVAATEKKWGTAEFNANKFKSGSTKINRRFFIGFLIFMTSLQILIVLTYFELG